MHSAFNMLVFPNSMFTLFRKNERAMCSSEIALINNHYYYYYYKNIDNRSKNILLSHIYVLYFGILLSDIAFCISAICHWFVSSS